MLSKDVGDQQHRTGGVRQCDGPVFSLIAPSAHIASRYRRYESCPLSHPRPAVADCPWSLETPQFRVVVTPPFKPNRLITGLSISICPAAVSATATIRPWHDYAASRPNANTWTANHQSDTGQPIPPADFQLRVEIIVERHRSDLKIASQGPVCSNRINSVAARTPP